MTNCGTVGEIAQKWRTDEELSVEWKITDFLSLSDEVGDWHESPLFGFSDGCWSLCLFPNGEAWNSTSGRLCIWLVRLDAGPPKNVHFSFGIESSDAIETLTSDGPIRSQRVEKISEGCHEFSENAYARGVQFWSRSDLGSRRKSRLTSEDAFVFTCDIKRNNPLAIIPSMSDVIRSLETILTEGRRAYFTLLKAGSREWPAPHKTTAEDRSECFADAFRQERAGNSEDRLEGVREDTLEIVLQFICSGEVEGMALGNVCEIFAVGHKFLLEDLKLQCVEFMRENMCAGIVCEALAVAKIHEEKDLEESALGFIFREADQIFDSEEWKQFKRNHASSIEGILEQIIKGERNKQRKEQD